MRRVGILALIAGAVLVIAQAVSAAGPPDALCKNATLPAGVYHNVTVAQGSWCQLSGGETVTGNFQASQATAIGIFGGVTIDGDLQASNTTSHPSTTGMLGGGSHNYICNTNVLGNLQIVTSGSSAPWNIGGTTFPPPPDFSHCGVQSAVGGDLQFMNNVGTGGNDISGNDVEGNLQCQNNAPFVVPDTVNGVDGSSQGQCAGAAFAVKGDSGHEPQPADKD